MPITLDQQRELIKQAKARKPDLSPDEAKLIIERANQQVDAAPQPKVGVDATPTKTNILDIIKKIPGGLADTFLGDSIRTAQATGQAAGLGSQLPELQKSLASQQDQSRLLIEAAKLATDPTQKQQLLAASRELDAASGELTGSIQDISDTAIKTGQITDAELANKALFNLGRGARIGVQVPTAAALASGIATPGAATSFQPGINQAVPRTAAIAAKQGFVKSAVPAALLGATDLNAKGAGDRAARAALSAITAGAVGAAAGAGSQALQKSIGTRAAQKAAEKQAQGQDSVGQILNKADQVSKEQKQKAPGTFRRIYQAAFPFSKKGDAVERLTPEETVDDMIKYNVVGTGEGIRQKADKVSGRNGILSNVVNNAVVDTPDQALPVNNIERAMDVDDLSARYTMVPKDVIKNQVLRLSTLNPAADTGDDILKVDLTSAVDLERQLSKEAFDSAIQAGKNKSARAAQEAALKAELAEELGNAIDRHVGKTPIDRYKDPRIVEALKSIGGDKLAEDYLKASSISDLRSLQKSFVRMGRIVDLSNEVPSSLGQQFFKALSQFPVLGQIVESGLKPAGELLSTATAVGGSNIQKGIERGVAAAPSAAARTAAPSAQAAIAPVSANRVNELLTLLTQQRR